MTVACISRSAAGSGARPRRLREPHSFRASSSGAELARRSHPRENRSLKDEPAEAKAALAGAISLKPHISSQARLRAYRPWEVNPQYRKPSEKTFGLGLRRAGFPDE